MNGWLQSLNGTNSTVLGLVIGLMMAFDMGGPVNKAAYTFGVGTLVAGQASEVMAAVMAAGMVPPLGLALATIVAKINSHTKKKKLVKQHGHLGSLLLQKGLSHLQQQIQHVLFHRLWQGQL